MNIEDLLKDPNKLEDVFKKTIETNDELMMDKLYMYSKDPYNLLNYAIKNQKSLPYKKELIVASRPDTSYEYARKVLRERFPLGEKEIMKSSKYSYLYAKDVIHRKWPPGEPAIASSGVYSYYYATIFWFRFKEGEKAIIKNKEVLYDYIENLKKMGKLNEFYKDHPELNDPTLKTLLTNSSQLEKEFQEALENKDIEKANLLAPYSTSPINVFNYAKDILKGPFPEGEIIIAQDIELAFRYIEEITFAPFQYKHIFTSTPENAFRYAELFKEPFPEGEDIIAQNPELSYRYATEILKGPFPKGEDIIKKNPYWAVQYIKNVLKDRKRSWEPYIKGDIESWKEYLEFLKSINQYENLMMEEETEKSKKEKRIKPQSGEIEEADIDLPESLF